MNNNSDGQFLLNLINNRIKEEKIISGKLNLNTKDRFSRTALYWAISYQKVEDVKLLLKHSISQEVAPNLNAFTHALNINNQEIIKLFDREDMALSA